MGTPTRDPCHDKRSFRDGGPIRPGVGSGPRVCSHRSIPPRSGPARPPPTKGKSDEEGFFSSSAAVLALSGDGPSPTPAPPRTPVCAGALGTTSPGRGARCGLAATSTKNWKDFDILDAAAPAVLADDEELGRGGAGRRGSEAHRVRTHRQGVPDASSRTSAADVRRRRASVMTLAAAKRDRHHRDRAALPRGRRADPRPRPRCFTADGAELTTAQGGTTGQGQRIRQAPQVVLVDQDQRRLQRPGGRASDINKGNRQIAHGINRVLRPVDL